MFKRFKVQSKDRRQPKTRFLPAVLRQSEAYRKSGFGSKTLFCLTTEQLVLLVQDSLKLAPLALWLAKRLWLNFPDKPSGIAQNQSNGLLQMGFLLDMLFSGGGSFLFFCQEHVPPHSPREQMHNIFQLHLQHLQH